MRTFWRNFRGAFRRVIPDCMAQAQSIAFNLFLSFFPILLFALGVLALTTRSSTAVHDQIRGLRWMLPQSSSQMVVDFLVAQGRKSGTLLALGVVGTFLTGTQVITGFLSAFRNIYRDSKMYGYWRDQFRGLLLLFITFIPFVVISLLQIFGRPLRAWMVTQFGLPRLFDMIWFVVYGGLSLVVIILVLALLYRAGHPGGRSWNEFLPGAILATALWWTVNAAFAWYVRKVPYSVVYGSMAAVIGLMVWMNLIAIVVLLGAAFNAERHTARGIS